LRSPCGCCAGTRRECCAPSRTGNRLSIRSTSSCHSPVLARARQSNRARALRPAGVERGAVITASSRAAAR
jgi:hypothetical protein